MSFTRRYCAVFESAAGGILVSVPALPGCFSLGSSRTDAEIQIRDAASLYLAVCLRDGDAIPDSEAFRPMIASEGCIAGFVAVAADASGGPAEPGEQAGPSPIAGYEVAGATRRHVLIRRSFDHRKIVLPLGEERRVSSAIQRMVKRVLIGDRSFHVPFYGEGQ